MTEEKNKQVEYKVPQKGASKKWAERLKKTGERKPPQEIVDKINGNHSDSRKIASPEMKP